MKHYRPNKRSLIVLRIAVLLLTAAIIALDIILIPIKLAVNISVITVSAVAFILVFIYLPLFFSSVKYTATETEIVKTSGVFIKFHQSVRYSSVQYTTVITTPLSQYTGLNFIVFFVYGGQLDLLFLDQHDALAILSLVQTGGVRH